MLDLFEDNTFPIILLVQGENYFLKIKKDNSRL